MSEYLKFAIEISAIAGAQIRRNFDGLDSHSLKTDGTVLTKTDTAINDLVVEAVRKRYPDHSVLGEERSVLHDGAEFTWVCDPIDGTLSFVMGVPTSVFALALADRDGAPIVAVVHDPYLNRTYRAEKGGGAYLNDTRIHVNDTGSLAGAIIGLTGVTSNVLDSTGYKSAILQRCYRPAILNSALYESSLVASGRMAASVFPGAGPHDVACAKLIVEEAGGRVTNVRGVDQAYDRPIAGAVISNGRVHDDLIALLQPYLLKP